MGAAAGIAAYFRSDNCGSDNTVEPMENVFLTIVILKFAVVSECCRSLIPVGVFLSGQRSHEAIAKWI